MPTPSTELTVGSSDRLSFTIFLAIAVHAIVIFGISFKVDSGQKIAPTLNITLATHKSKEEPKKADFLAQFDQKASGTELVMKELTTQKVADINDSYIREVNPFPQVKASIENTSDIQPLTTEQEKKFKIRKVEEPNEDSTSQAQEGLLVEAPVLNPEIATLKAKLSKLRQDLAKQPRIRRLTSVSTKASYDAEYLNRWTQKVEQVGNNNFPEAALSNGIFGNLRLSVLIMPSGDVEKVEILQSSGYPILDDSAVQIVKLSSPFARFPPEIRKTTDKLEIIRTWRFEITGLSTTR